MVPNWRVVEIRWEMVTQTGLLWDFFRVHLHSASYVWSAHHDPSRCHGNRVRMSKRAEGSKRLTGAVSEMMEASVCVLIVAASAGTAVLPRQTHRSVQRFPQLNVPPPPALSTPRRSSRRTRRVLPRLFGPPKALRLASS